MHECTASFLLYRFLQYISIYINYNTNNLRKRINNVKDKGVCNLFCRRLFGDESPGQQICPSIKKGEIPWVHVLQSIRF